MKRTVPAVVVLVSAMTSCLDSADEDLDLQSPRIMPTGISEVIAPEHFMEVSEQAMSIPLAFQVEDESGISEIFIESHSGFDGHTHGRTDNSDFVLLNYGYTVEEGDLDDPRIFQSELNDDLVIHLDDRNPLIPTGALVLAGPYHFSIKAADVEGNETSYADNTTYHSTMYVQRDYAPRMEIDGIDRTTGTVSGIVWRNMDHSASSDIVFLWVHISTPDPTNPAQEGEIRAEWLWGDSNWPHQFRDNAGAQLGTQQVINLAELLAEQQAIRQMTESELLTVWAEDANGNISVRSF